MQTDKYKGTKVLNSEQSEESRFRGTRVLILGLGVNQGGLGATKFFAKQGVEVKVTDLKTKEELKYSLDALKEFKNIEYILGEHREEDIDWADLIIRNPALKPDNKYRRYAEMSGKRVEMDMGIFLEYVRPDQIVGITGTKGKSTTSSLIYEVLKQCLPNVTLRRMSSGHSSVKGINPTLDSSATPQNDTGINILFAGNIGKSVLDTIPFITEDTLVVLELSSFQLEAFDQHKVSPKWSVITNILPDHLNYYGTMQAYIEAKRVIARYQKEGDYIFINRFDQSTNNPQFLNGLKGKLIYFSELDLPIGFEGTLPGDHNRSNYAAALQVAKTFQIREKDALIAANNFKGVEFRLQLIKEWKGIKIYNDTAATSPAATLSALNAIKNPILIAGGVNKNLPYEELGKEIGEKAKSVYFLEGDATDLILSSLRANTPNVIPSDPPAGGEESPANAGTLSKSQPSIHGPYNNFEDLLTEVKKEAKKGDVILFSPGAASFNLFANEFDRGRKFNAAVEKIFN